MDSTPVLAEAERAGSAPLSYAQEQLWLVDRMLGGATLAAAPLAVEVTGPLDVSALRRALAGLVARHEALRTTFAMTADGLVQRVGPVAEVDLTVLDRRDVPVEQLHRAALDELSAGFDLATGPLLRTRVYRTGPDTHLVLIVRHHLVFDASSDAVFRGELGALYAAERAGGPAQLPPVRMQYPEYARRQRARLTGSVLAGLLRHWSAVLAEPPAALRLPGSPGRPPTRRGPSRFLTVAVPDPVAAGVAAFAAARRVTPFMLAQAVLRAVLARHSVQPDVLVGVPVTTRTEPEVQRTLGFLLNLLVLRCPVPPGATVGELVDRERAAVLAAYDHQELPYPVLARELGRDGAAPGIVFAFDVEDAPASPFPDLDTVEVDLGAATAQHQLEAKLVRSGTGTEIRFAYDEDAFHGAAVAAVADGFLEALTAAVRDPDLPVADLPCGTPYAAAEVEELTAVAGPRDTARPPAGAVEELVAELWGELLGVEPATAGDDLFALGGHSLTVARLGHALEEELGVRVTVAELFENPTVERQAELVERLLRARLRDGVAIDRIAAELDRT